MLALGFASFLAFGVVLVLLGANQDEMARDLGLDLSRSGLLASALASGIGVGVVAAGPLVDRLPRRPIYLAAVAVAAAGLFGFRVEMSYARAVGLAALVGVGVGVYDTLISTLVVERYRERSARPMSAVHAAATLGAMLGPLLIGWLAARSGWAASFHWTGAAHLALAGAAFALPFPAPDPTRQREQASSERPLLSALLPFAAVGFAYVGLETGLTIFAKPYAAGLDLDATRGLTAISAFWLGLLAGRLALLGFRGTLDARLLVGAGVFGAISLGVGSALGVRQVELHFAVTGLALGFVFPLMVALAGARFPHARGTAVGLVTGAGSLGAFFIPWLHGEIGDRVGIGVAVGSLAAWAVVMAVAALTAGRER